MIVFSESAIESPISASAQDNNDMTQAAILAGCKVYYIPSDYSLCANAENALWHVPEQSSSTDAIWIGFIPSEQRYKEIYQAALDKNIKIINTPEQHIIAQEFDRAYPLLMGITPKSKIISTLTECNNAGAELGYPLFVRGSVRSCKHHGWKASVANNLLELQNIVIQFLQSVYRSRGKVIVRELVSLRHSRYSDQQFPLGREYRIFLLNGQIVGYGYYWEGDDPLKTLSSSEKVEVIALAQKVYQRIKVPFIAVDIGQLVDESWIVIEVNDAQFAGTSQIPTLPLWNAIIKTYQDQTDTSDVDNNFDQ